MAMRSVATEAAEASDGMHSGQLQRAYAYIEQAASIAVLLGELQDDGSREVDGYQLGRALFGISRLLDEATAALDKHREVKA